LDLDSELFLALESPSSNLQGFGVLPVGSFDIDCGAVDPITGQSVCSCELRSIDPIPLLGIGDVCVAPAGPCEPGVFACDGGVGLDLDTVSDHNIGACTSNASCSSQCDAFCATLGSAYAPLSFTCEGFCQAGSNAEAACIEDVECPESNCPGKEPQKNSDGSIVIGTGPHAGACNCTCGGQGLGGAAPAGSLTCNLGLAISVERDKDLICGNQPAGPDIVLAPLCGALTTTSGAGAIDHANNGTKKKNTIPPRGKVPFEGQGAGISCDDYASGNLTGMTLTGDLVFYDSALGDILTRNTFSCK